MLRVSNTNMNDAGLLHPGWTLSLPLIALTAVIVSPPEHRILMILASAPVFALMQWTLPQCRFRTDHYFCPVNVGLLLMLVKLVIAPILVTALGSGNDMFVAAPSQASMEGSVLIDVIAYIAFCVGLTFIPQYQMGHRRSSLVAVLSETPGSAIVLLFAVLGFVGFVLAFGSPARLLQYFREPTAVTDLQKEYEGNWTGFLGVMLRPFLAFSLVAWWARSVDRAADQASQWRPMLTGVAAAIGITVANLTFSFNRAAFVFPLISLVAVYSARTRRISPWATALTMAILFPCLFAIGNYRANMLAPVGAPVGNGGLQSTAREVSETIQSYAGGPPLTALFLEEVGWGTHLYGGSTLVASALSPIPILGRNFRESSGSSIYNRTLYGTPGFEDQIIPFSTELFANFHALGVVAGFFALGLLLGKADLWFTAVRSPFGAFAIQYVFMWCAMLSVWSLSIVSQIAIYFLGPIYLYWAATQTRMWLRNLRFYKAAISTS